MAAYDLSNLWVTSLELTIQCSMALTSLLVCADAASVQVLTRIFHELGIDVEACAGAPAAEARLGERQFNALVLDCQDESSALSLLKRVRSSSAGRGSVVIALVSSSNAVQEVFRQGANFVLYKPLSRERALHSLHAARALIRQERRVKERVPVHAPASIAYGGKEDLTATIVELNETGMGIRTSDAPPVSGKVYFQFTLPGQDSDVRLAGEVMWRDASGRVGIRFLNVPQASKRVLQKWLRDRTSTRPSSDAAVVTYEDERSTRLSAGLGLLSASAPDRRNLSRRACRLGAEVYGAQSNVPQRCVLTDISSGGCYVETTDPFPAGTEVFLVVRTHELKLSVEGKVQSMHRAFGMGVRFKLASERENQQVQQLINCAEQQEKLIR